ncbi:methyltransferase [Spirillospora sp. NPDC052269]
MLLDKCFQALKPGGLLVICELLLDDDLTGPAMAALASMNMLIRTRAGRNYTTDHYLTWLTEAGFHDAHRTDITATVMNGAIIATRPQEPRAATPTDTRD